MTTELETGLAPGALALVNRWMPWNLITRHLKPHLNPLPVPLCLLAEPLPYLSFGWNLTLQDFNTIDHDSGRHHDTTIDDFV